MSSDLCRSEWCDKPVHNWVLVSGGSRIESESVTSRRETHTKLDIILVTSPSTPPLTTSRMHEFMVFQPTNWIREDFSVPSHHREKYKQGFRDDYSKEKREENGTSTAACCRRVRLVCFGIWVHDGTCSATSHGPCMVMNTNQSASPSRTTSVTGSQRFAINLISRIYNDNTESWIYNLIWCVAALSLSNNLNLDRRQSSPHAESVSQTSDLSWMSQSCMNHYIC